MKICISLLLLLYFKFNAVFAQNVTFSLTPSTNLNLIYQTANDFESERVISNAFQLNLRGRNTRFLVSAKTISSLNYSFTSIPTDVFSIQLNNTNASVASNYYRRFPLNFSDQNILYQLSNNNRTYNFNYDLIFKEVGYEYEPGQYFYTIIFTVSEL